MRSSRRLYSQDAKTLIITVYGVEPFLLCLPSRHDGVDHLDQRGRTHSHDRRRVYTNHSHAREAGDGLRPHLCGVSRAGRADGHRAAARAPRAPMRGTPSFPRAPSATGHRRCSSRPAGSSWAPPTPSAPCPSRRPWGPPKGLGVGFSAEATPGHRRHFGHQAGGRYSEGNGNTTTVWLS